MNQSVVTRPTADAQRRGVGAPASRIDPVSGLTRGSRSSSTCRIRSGGREPKLTFRPIYEAAATVFLLQGLLTPVVMFAFGGVWFRQMERLAAVKRLVGWDAKRKEKHLAALLEAVPKLAPLSCSACGSPMALEAARARCIGCKASVPLPEDYRATMRLRRMLPRLASAAVRHWWAARVLTSTPMRWLLRLMVAVMPALFVVTVIGAATYSDTFLDRAFDRIGEDWSMVVMLMAFGGFVSWMIVFALLAAIARDLRRKLPAFPKLRSRGTPADFATCRACGGGVAFERGRLAGLCGYCTVPNYRAEAARHERGASEDDKARMHGSLFAAMDIIEDFVGTLFITMLILVVAFAVLAIASAIGGD